MVVIYSIDSSYLWSFFISIYSAKTASVKEISFKLALSPNALNNDEITLIQSFAKYFEIELELLLLPNSTNLVTVNHVSKNAFNKFFIPKFLDYPYLWMDSDTLCASGWDKIFDYQISLNKVLAARIEEDRASPVVSGNQARIRAGSSYFNSGVMLISPQEFNRNELLVNWDKVAIQREELGFELNDQDVWNYILAGEIDCLPPQFNVFADGRDSATDGRIIHFLGKKKPWHFSNDHKIYLALAEMLKWRSEEKDVVLDGMNLEWYMRYWKIEAQLLVGMQFRNPCLFDSLRQVRDREIKNHFDRKFEIKARVVSKIVRLFVRDFLR